MADVVFNISIPSWDKHNSTKKKNHRSFKLENRFFSDDKIAQLSAVETRFYLYLLTVAADLNQSSYTLHTKLIPSYFRLRTQSIHDSLTKFESLQLLTFEKVVSKRREEKRKEDNIKEENPDKNNLKTENLETQENQKPVYETLVPEKTNSVQGFHARLVDAQRENPFLKTLEEWDLKKPVLENNLHLVEKTFKTNEKLVLWLEHVVTRPNYQKAKTESRVAADNYLTKALKIEMGLAG